MVKFENEELVEIINLPSRQAGKAAALNIRNEFRLCIVPRWRGLGVD
jgi:hypothetical protein